jgi:diamine N-acetyltransferase
MTFVKHLPAVREAGQRQQPCTIRRAVAEDAAVLSAFATRTFIETYAEHHDPTNLRLHALDAFATARQRRELADPLTTTLLAYRGETLCGFAQMRCGAAPDCVVDPMSVELHRLYVDRRWHGLGVGKDLLQQVQRTALALDALTLWLKVWERNARALAFYAKSGFVDAGTADFFVRNDRLTDRVLIAPLTPI